MPTMTDEQKPPITYRTERFALTEGEIVIHFPAQIDPADLQDVKEWLPIVSRKLERAARTALGEKA